MKQFIFLLTGIVLLFGKSNAQNASYDSTLAKKFSADDYGMRMYTFVLLKSGKVNNLSKELTDSIFRGHMDNINRLEKEGQLIIAGPFGKNEYGYRGLFVINETDISKVKEMLNADPAISSGVLNAEIINWYGSAAIPIYLDYHSKIWKKMP